MLIRNPTVASVVLEHPSCAPVFHKYRIDFCCGGDVTVDAACAARGLDVETVRAELEAAMREPGPSDAETARALPTPALVERIVDRHHAYLRRTLPAVVALASKVARVHGSRELKLRPLQVAVQELADELGPHLDREEQVLFPSLLDVRASSPETVAELEQMMGDHRAVAVLLDRIHEASDGFRVPAWGCNSYRALFSELRNLDADIRAHVHLENYVLRPRFLPAPATPS
jgi:regulator of cell morphogenesis and NO signaling